MKKKLVVFWAAAVSLMVAAPASLLAACGQAVCPIEISSLVEHPLGSGQVYFNFVYEYIDQDRPFIDSGRAKVGELPREHDEISTRNSSYKFTLDYGLTPRFTLGVMFPLLDRLHRHVEHEEHEPHDEEVEAPEEVRVPARWRFLALGDMQLSARYLLLQAAIPVATWVQTTVHRRRLALVWGMSVSEEVPCCAARTKRELTCSHIL